MRAILNSFCPTKAATKAGCPALTPELSASVAARRSRSPDSLEEILAKIGDDQDRAVDIIFAHVDYGHQSIADMAPVSIHMEGVSLWLIQYVWSLVHVGGGQESSTRYINFGKAAPADLDDRPLNAAQLDSYMTGFNRGMEAYANATMAWESIATKHPELIGIPKGASDKVVARFQKNFVCDRARYWLPLATLSSFNVTTWAREWAGIVKTLRSSPWAEARQLGDLALTQLTLAAPRMTRHCEASSAELGSFMDDFNQRSQVARDIGKNLRIGWEECGISAEPLSFLHIYPPHIDQKLGSVWQGRNYVHDLRHHDNRYAPIGKSVKGTAVEYGWNGIADAEIRDMNRHRPGQRIFDPLPMGFYWAQDQLPDFADTAEEVALLRSLATVGADASEMCLQLLQKESVHYPYWSLLGTQFNFSHTSTLDKLIYELQLRTGIGTHFRYRQHYLSVLDDLYQQYPGLRSIVKAGTGEPE